MIRFTYQGETIDKDIPPDPYAIACEAFEIAGWKTGTINNSDTGWFLFNGSETMTAVHVPDET